ncbi:MAG: transglycosylase domain-containing protein [Rhodobacteraceae bacterium]|nr:transglycosylase domain-containing protein [Paracoccaceae bacterium]
MSTNGRKKAKLVAPRRSSAAPAKTGSRRKASAGKRRKGGNFITRFFGWIVLGLWRMVWWMTWRAAGLVFLALAISTGYFYLQLPPPEAQVDGRVRGSVTMLDRDGNVFAWRGEQFGGMIRASTVSPYLKNAVVATEDKRFYRHFGISPRGIASAIRINLAEGRGPLSGHGGSTITQQVAKILCLGRNYDPDSGISERDFEADCRQTSIARKLKEVPYSLAMELKYTKDEILMIYLNRVFLGAGAQGFEAASQRYFGKSSSAVSPAEAAMLAGLLVAPSYYAPTRDLERSQNRAAVIIGLMREQGYLSKAEAELALASPAELSEAAEAVAGGYYADWVMETGPSFLTRNTTEDVLIRTTFDARIQKAAEDALAQVFETQVREGSKAQAAIVVMSADGAVRAMVGGRRSKVAGQFNRATQALRQTGSSFKPFVYAAALDLGYRFDSLVEDAPLTLDVPGSGPWSPKNYTGDYLGTITLTEALAKSINTAAVRISEDVGREAVRTVARDFGIHSELDIGPALALGTSEATLLEMTGAYAGILNGGTSVRPYGLLELSLQGDNAPLMGKSGGLGERVISTRAARQLTYMMNQVTEYGSGRRAKLPDRPAAAKTGTTQGARDAWFIGFTADYVTGVWMGYDDNSKLSGVTGGGLPAEIWRETMLRVNDGVPPRPLPMIDPAEEGPPPPGTPGAAAPIPPPQMDPAQSILDEVLGAIFGRRQ